MTIYLTTITLFSDTDKTNYEKPQLNIIIRAANENRMNLQVTYSNEFASYVCCVGMNACVWNLQVCILPGGMGFSSDVEGSRREGGRGPPLVSDKPSDTADWRKIILTSI